MSNSNNQIATQAALDRVLKDFRGNRREVEAILPPDMNFAVFYSAIKQALLNNPDILSATPISIVQACMKAAYDGLRLDGKEAALVTHKVTVDKQTRQTENRAQYFPMVYGLVQQILRGGEVLSFDAFVVYENDEFSIELGTNPIIRHKPCLVGDPGQMILAYSVAVLKSGEKSTQFLRKDQIEDVMKSSRSGWHEKDQKPIGVWAKWPRQMWLKTMIRFHRKTLPMGGRVIADTEEKDLYAQERQDNPMGLVDRSEQSRPTRESTRRQLADQSVEYDQYGVVLDLPPEEQREPVEAVGKRNKGQAKAQQNQQSAQQPDAEPIPLNETEWSEWAAYVEDKVLTAPNTQAINELAKVERCRIDKADAERRDYINGLITDRLVELASDGAAPSSAEGNQGGQE